MKVTLHHLITVEEEVTIPDKCPKCEVTFLGKGALKVWEYQDQVRHAEVDLHGDFDWWDLPKGGDNSLYQSWACGECGHMLAESDTAGFHLKLGHPRPPLEVLKILKSKYANNGLPEYAKSPEYAEAYKKRKESKKHGDECPNCGCGTLEETDDEFVCRGECGEVWPKVAKRLKDILEVYECDCGFHLGVDATYLEQVTSSVEILCPSCGKAIKVEQSRASTREDALEAALHANR